MANTDSFGSPASTGGSTNTRYNSPSTNLGSSQQSTSGYTPAAQTSTNAQGQSVGPSGLPLPAAGQYGNFSGQGYTPTNYQQDPSQVTPSGNPYQSQATPGAVSNGPGYGNTPQSYQQTQQGMQAQAPAPQQGNSWQQMLQGGGGGQAQQAQQNQQMQNNMRAQPIQPQAAQAIQSQLGALFQNQQAQGSAMGGAPQGNNWTPPNLQAAQAQQQMSMQQAFAGAQPPSNAPQQGGYFANRMQSPSRYTPVQSSGTIVS